jgi:hypothetical protein
MNKNFVRRTMKKMAAIGTGVAMVGATLTGALAADLADYPEPFVVDGVYDDANAFVIGDAANGVDVLGLADITTNLQFESKIAVTGAGTGVSVEGGVTEKIPLGGPLAAASFFDTTLQDDDIASLFDGEVTFQSSTYDTSEELVLTATDPIVQTSLSASEDDYLTDVYLEVLATKSVQLNYKFDETITLNDTTTSDPLRIDFMGQRLQVTSIDSDTKLTAYVGEEHYLQVDQSVEIEGKTVTLIDVSSTSAVIDVDGVSEIISVDGTESVNGLEITVDDAFSRTERAESSANLIMGIQSAESYQDGDAFIGEDTSDPEWVWNLLGLLGTGTTQTFGIENDFSMNDASDNPPGVGECLSLPWGYVEICVDSLSVGEDDYADYTFEWTDSADLSEALNDSWNSANAIYIHTNADEGMELLSTDWASSVNHELNGSAPATSIKTDKVWLYMNDITNNTYDGSSTTLLGNAIAVFYEDTNSRTKLYGHVAENATLANPILRFDYGSTKDTNVMLDLAASTVSGNTGNVTLTLDIKGDSTTDLAEHVDDIDMVWGLAAGEFDSLGATQSQEEALEIRWGTSDTTIGTKDEDHRSRYGIIVKNPDSNGASDEIELSVPDDQVFANVVIKGTSTTVTGGSTTYVPANVTPVTKLASEVGTATDYNLVLVGGPCANELVDDLFDITCADWSLETGQAFLKLADNGDKVALLVAGTNADDTRRAAKALAGHADYALSGSEVIVSGTSLSDVNIETA